MSKSQPLTPEMATDAMEVILAGEADPFELGALLAALRIKEETAAELTAFVQVADRHMIAVPGSPPDLTIASYAGKRQTYPALLASACILAACDVTVGLHGHAHPVSRMALADGIAALGGNPDGDAAAAADDLSRAGIAYVGVEQFLPVMHAMLELRRKMGLRSCFHTMARLVNPYRAPVQLLGISHERSFNKLAQASHALGYRSVLSFRGLEGEPEVNPLTATTGFRLAADGTVTELPIAPATLGIASGSRRDVTVADAAGGAAMVRSVLAGNGPTVGVDTATLTAAAGLLAVDRVANLDEGLACARAAVADGRAADRLGRWLGVGAR